LDDAGNGWTLQSLYPHPDHRRSVCAGDGKNCVKIRVKGHNNLTDRSSVFENRSVRRSRHSDPAYMRTLNADGPQLCSRVPWQSLIEENVNA
jgi:hypothetical protein